VHKKLGSGFVEKIYEKALVYEFKKENLYFVNQSVIKVEYEELELGNQRVDFIVAEEIIVEIKSVSRIIEIFEYQILSYLKTSKKRVGVILNFGKKSLEIKRIVYNL
jgi:GxxExxY protein